MRQPRGLFRYSDPEWAAIVRAAERAGMRAGPWAQRVAYEAAARRQADPVVGGDRAEALLVELRQHRRVLTNIGGNLNDVARVANATGEIANLVAAQAVLRLVSRVVATADELLVRVRSELL